MDANASRPERTVTYTYTIELAGGAAKKFQIVLDYHTMRLIPPAKDEHPEWAQLDFFQCPNCPLDTLQHRHCPVADNIAPVVESFRECMSYDRVKVICESANRTCLKEVSLQEGLSSVIGIYMVTSGCPILAKLSPVVRYHLPFSNEEETKFRAMSLYLIAQYFINKRGGTPDWDLKNLVTIYDQIRIVNKAFCKRLSNIKIKDSSINALVTLDCFADSISFSINENLMEEIETLFQVYFE
ncbi:DUF6901 family protein [Thermodesulfobacteriota bacterium]